MTSQFRQDRTQAHSAEDQTGCGNHSPAEDRVVVLEEALCEYIGRFGLTDKAREALRLAGTRRPV